MVTTRSTSRFASAQPIPTPTATSPTGNALEIDPIAKAKTIAHMNKDHGADMSAILRHSCHLSAADAADPELLDLDLATLTIHSRSGTHAVPLNPPMGSWADRRTRIVEMTIEARIALGLDAVVHQERGGDSATREPTIATAAAAPRAPPTSFYPPSGMGIVSFVAVSWYFVWLGLVYTGNVTPDSAPWRFIELLRFPGGPELYVWLVKAIGVPVFLIHSVEAFYLMAVKRLAPNGVPVGSLLWLLWVLCTFLEGFPAWKRFDRKVLRKKNQ